MQVNQFAGLPQAVEELTEVFLHGGSGSRSGSSEAESGLSQANAERNGSPTYPGFAPVQSG